MAKQGVTNRFGKRSAPPDDLEIAPGYSVRCWKLLKLEPSKPDSADWKIAVDIFDRRIQCRFLQPIDRLIELEKPTLRGMYGFTILAVDFLVVETVQAFRNGMISHKGQSKKLIVEFLMQWDAFRDCVPPGADADRKCGEQLYYDCRCALHHSGSTTGALRVRVSGPMLAFSGDNLISINRTCFHTNLKREFKTYLNDLLAVGNNDLRAKFKKKMDAVCNLGTTSSNELS